MRAKTKRPSAKEIILQKASELFYRQGYNATGIQQIIDDAGISKGAFYTHYKTKSDLGLAYLQKRHTDEISAIKEKLAKFKTPYEKYTNFGKMMKEWIKANDFRGCAFAHMNAEITDASSPIRKEAKYHYEAFRALIRDVVGDLIKSEKRFAHLNADHLTDDFMLIMVGALTNSEIYLDVWPFDRATAAVKELLGNRN
jgi:AcrR family transcriptional regulator